MAFSRPPSKSHIHRYLREDLKTNIRYRIFTYCTFDSTILILMIVAKCAFEESDNLLLKSHHIAILSHLFELLPSRNT